MLYNFDSLFGCVRSVYEIYKPILYYSLKKFRFNGWAYDMKIMIRLYHNVKLLVNSKKKKIHYCYMINALSVLNVFMSNSKIEGSSNYS